MKLKPRNTAVAAVFLLGIVLTVVVFLMVRRGALERFSLIFEQLSHARVLSISRSVEFHRRELEAFRRFYEQSGEVTGREFNAYVKPMLEHPCVKTVEWIPLLRQHERAAFEARTGIRVKEPDLKGQLVPARERAEYFPIAKAFPFEPNEAAMGFDLASNPARWAALEKARDEGRVSSMELLRLVEDPDGPAYFMAVAPVYGTPSETPEASRRNLRGFVLGMYRIEGLVDLAMSRLPEQGLAFILEDLDAPPGKRLLYRHDPRIGTFDWTSISDSPFKHVGHIENGGRLWRMTVMPNDAFVKEHLSRIYWWILPAGLLLSGLVGLSLHMQMEGRLRAERLVRERTAELQESEGRLWSVFRAAPIGIGVTVDRMLREVNARMCEMTGYSREEMIGQSTRIFYVDDEDYEHVGREKYRQIDKHGTGTVETRWKCRDGHVIDVLLSSAPMDTADLSKGVTFTALDITERKRAEELLRSAKQQFQHIVDNSCDVICQIDPKGNFIFCNPIAETVSGYSLGELLEMNMMELVAPEYHAELSMRLQQRIAGKTGAVRVSFEVVCKEGARKWMELVTNGVFDKEGALVAVQGLARDVTERKMLEQVLQESESRFRGMFEHISSGVAIYEAVDGGEDFVFVDFNPAGERIEKIARKDVIGRRLLEAFPASREMGLFEVLQRVWSTGRPESFPISFYKDERIEGWRENYVYRLASGEVVAVYDDRTAQKQAEAERDRLMTAIDQVAETIVITDAEGTIQYANPSFESITGYSREEALGENPRILKSGRHDDAFYADMWETLLSGETWSGRIINRKKDETLYTEDATISPVKDRGGKIVNFVAIKSDITVELAREERYRQVQKMETVGRLAGGVAHDFNNILQTITGFCELILVEMDEQSTQRQDVLEVQKAAHLAGTLTQQLLAFSREKPTQYREIDINTVLSDGRKMLEQSLGESVQLNVDLGSPMKPVVADASQILQIALNLVVNARDAMPNGGTITVRTQNLEIKEEHLSAWPTARMGEWVCFSVLDNGSGMDENQMQHLFEPFYTTKKLGEGTGLGLSVVYGIVEEHGGWIHVESEPGKGTLFRICLPVRGAGEADAAAGVLERDEFKGKRILLVEDDAVVRELTAEILQDVGYAVLSVESAQEAREVFARKNGAFDLLFVDIMLPDGNGIELVDTLLKQKEDISVLLASGHVDEKINMELIKEKGLNFVRKPYNLSGLLREVNSLLVGR